MSDEELTSAWLSCELGRSIGHEEHLRISFVILRSHGPVRGRLLIAEATRRNCEALAALDRYDDELTARWSAALADAVEASEALDADEFLSKHQQFRQSDLFGAPAWKT